MKASDFLNKIKLMGIDTIAGVPDSTLKQFCDALQIMKDGFSHYTPANEGAAVGIAIGSYMATGKPACVYMQNSGIGNIVNPVCSLANNEVYGIPMLFVCGWRGEPGVKDEPQHIFQGKITCDLFETMHIDFAVVDEETTLDEIDDILAEATACFERREQYVIIVKKGTFEKEYSFKWDNRNSLVREDALKKIVSMLPQDVCMVSTTGKISREMYEAGNEIYGNHDNMFLTVGGMGHASMIAYGIAQAKPDKKILCIDGDGAMLMHMGASAFIASHAPENFYHIVINNMAHESVGAMPTDCPEVSFAQIADAAGYKAVYTISSLEEMDIIRESIINGISGPILFEIKVSLGSRDDLGRPKESASDNRAAFMKYLAQ